MTYIIGGDVELYHHVEYHATPPEICDFVDALWAEDNKRLFKLPPTPNSKGKQKAGSYLHRDGVLYEGFEPREERNSPQLLPDPKSLPVR